MRTTPIPVTVGTFEARRQQQGPKVTTVTRMEALAPKTTTVNEATGWGGGGRGGWGGGGGGLGGG